MNVKEFYPIYLNHPEIVTDSRKITKDCLFFALKGANFNGNKFAEKALEDGAAFAIIDEPEYKKNDKYILVNDVLVFLQNLAYTHRKNLNIPFIGIGGSNGKTTTKELTKAVLGTTFKTYGTEGNLNNQIGVPLTILKIKKDAEMAVIELGANHLNEHEFLCTIVEPDFAIVTNNGKDHLEGFGSIEGVKKANAEIFDFMRHHKGKIFLNIDHQDLIERAFDIDAITYGKSENAKVQAKILGNQNLLSVYWTSENLTINTQLFGDYNFENVLAAITIGNYFGVKPEKIKQAIENYSPNLNRSQILEHNGNTLILDCYNANPSSMALALDSFERLDKPKKMIILGDMLELGEAAASEHYEMLNKVKNQHFEVKIFVGPEFLKYKFEADAFFFKTNEEAKLWFSQQTFEGYQILLKGSRGIAVEKVVM